MLDFAVDLARRAADVLMEHRRPLRRPDIVRRKSEQVRNLVTAADLESERLIVDEIRAAYPDHGIAAEEGSGGDTDREYVWHVDPLDGTVNFAHCHPFFSVSIGLARAGRPVLGVVHAPVLGETWAGSADGGSTLNGEPIRVSSTDSLIESVLATGFPYDRNESPNHNVDNFQTLIMLARGIRRAGAASLDFCYVAGGRLDGFWELSLSSWDMAAGAAILLGAGGEVTNFAGEPNILDAGNVVASNGRIHEAIRGTLAPLR
ncbi:MAG: inositol monophosphatase family protein [Planctomycetota bacterium]